MMELILATSMINEKLKGNRDLEKRAAQVYCLKDEENVTLKVSRFHVSFRRPAVNYSN